MSMNKPNAVDLIHFMEVLRILKCVWSGMYTMAIRVVEFSNGGYKIREIFA